MVSAKDETSTACGPTCLAYNIDPYPLTDCFLFPSLLSEDDFSVIQQEIVMVKSCKHRNIVAYYGSYIRSETEGGKLCITKNSSLYHCGV